MDIYQKTIPQLEQLLIDIVLKAEIYGMEWATARSGFETQKSKSEKIFSIACEKYDGSQAHKERRARYDEDYDRSVDALNILRESELKAKVQYDIALLKVDAIRTVLSNRREMVKREIL